MDKKRLSFSCVPTSSLGSYSSTRNFRSTTISSPLMAQIREDEEPELVKPPLTITPEFDSVCMQHRSDVVVNRTNWLKDLLQRNPQIQEIREVVNPIVRSTTFARRYLPNSRLVSHNILLALISQHLRILGLSETQTALHEEWESDFVIPHQLKYSQLYLLLQRGLLRSETFWETTMKNPHLPQKMQVSVLENEISRTIGAYPNLEEDPDPIRFETRRDKDKVNIENQELLEATLNQIIYFITDSKNDSNSLLKAFILTSSSYASNSVIFKKISDRILMAGDELKEAKKILSVFKENQQKGDPEYLQLKESKDKLKTDYVKAVNLLKEWLKSEKNNIEPPVIEKARVFFEKELNPHFEKLKNFYESTFFPKADSLSMSSYSNFLKPDIDKAVFEKIFKGQVEIFDLTPLETARQFTFWTSTRYYSIKRTELLNCPWEKPREKWRSPTINKLTNHFNETSKWAIYQVLKEKSIEKRLERWIYMIRLLEELVNLKNYLDAMAIYTGLISPPIFNLKHHQKRLPQEINTIFQNISAVLTLERNSAALRAAQDEAFNSSVPSIPYIGMLLGDLFSVHNYTASVVNGLINVRKIGRVYQKICKIEDFMRKKYNFVGVDQIQSLIDNLEYKEDSILDQLSSEAEALIIENQ